MQEKSLQNITENFYWNHVAFLAFFGLNSTVGWCVTLGCFGSQSHYAAPSDLWMKWDIAHLLTSGEQGPGK